jgi:hypothetical protein
LGRNERLGYLVTGDIGHGLENSLDGTQPFAGFFFNKKIGWTPTPNARMTCTGAGSPAAPSGGRTYTKVTLVYQAKPFLHLTLLESHKLIGADVFIL